MTKYTRREEAHLAAIFSAGSLIIAILMSLRHDTNHYAALVTLLFSVSLLLTSILAGAWTGAWLSDLRGAIRNPEKWVDTGALAGFALAALVIFRALG